MVSLWSQKLYTPLRSSIGSSAPYRLKWTLCATWAIMDHKDFSGPYRLYWLSWTIWTTEDPSLLLEICLPAAAEEIFGSHRWAPLLQPAVFSAALPGNCVLCCQLCALPTVLLLLLCCSQLLCALLFCLATGMHKTSEEKNAPQFHFSSLKSDQKNDHQIWPNKMQMFFVFFQEKNLP